MANWIFKPRRTMSAFTNRAEGKQLAPQLMQILPIQSWSLERVALSKYLSPQVKMCKRQLFISAHVGSTMSLEYFFRQLKSLHGFPSCHTASGSDHIAVQYQSRAISCFYLQPWWHHIPLGPPNPFWSISLVLMRLLLCEVHRYYNMQNKWHRGAFSFLLHCKELCVALKLTRSDVSTHTQPSLYLFLMTVGAA